MNYGAVILAGGKSSRMGSPKSCLRLNGVRFLDQLAYELRGFQELTVSVDDITKHPGITYPVICDLVPDCGPVGGLYTALKNSGCDALVTVPCDVPLFSNGLARWMCACLEEETERYTGAQRPEAGKGTGSPDPEYSRPDAVIMATMDGRIHPLCGVYRKSCLPVLEQCIRQRNYRVREALSRLDVMICQAGTESFRLFNINTPQDFTSLSLSGEARRNLRSDTGRTAVFCGRASDGLYPVCGIDAPQPGAGCGHIYQETADCLAVSGWKNSGKTTLIESLLPLLAQRGLKTAVLKHDGHNYEPDVPGRDSYRFFQAGADSSVIYDKDKYTVTRRRKITEWEITSLAQGVDLILMEGFKESGYPKIEIIRRETGQMPITGLKGRIALVSGMDIPADDNCRKDSSDAGLLPVFHPDDSAGLTDFIIEARNKGILKQRWTDAAKT